MLPVLGYLTTTFPLPTSPSATYNPAPPPPARPRLRRLKPSRLVARQAAGPTEAVDAAAGGDAREEEQEMEEEGFPGRDQEEEEEYDHDPEIADIMGQYFDDPNTAQSRMEDRIKKKRNKIVQAKTGSAAPMKVLFNKFDFSNSYIWFEFYNAPLRKDVSLLCDALRSWHIVGRLGGCNSMNMQLSQLPLDCKRPSYDTIEGANVTPTSFYNIGDLEIQDTLARVW